MFAQYGLSHLPLIKSDAEIAFKLRNPKLNTKILAQLPKNQRLKPWERIEKAFPESFDVYSLRIPLNEPENTLLFPVQYLCFRSHLCRKSLAILRPILLQDSPFNRILEYLNENAMNVEEDEAIEYEKEAKGVCDDWEAMTRWIPEDNFVIEQILEEWYHFIPTNEIDLDIKQLFLKALPFNWLDFATAFSTEDYIPVLFIWNHPRNYYWHFECYDYEAYCTPDFVNGKAVLPKKYHLSRFDIPKEVCELAQKIQAKGMPDDTSEDY